MTHPLGDQPIRLPQPWSDFGQRWQAWRQSHDRRRWADSWQGQAFQKGRLSFPSPWDDQLLETRLSLRVGNHLAYLLRAGEGRRALVFAGLVSNGHELEAVYLLQEKEWLYAPVSVAPATWYGLGLARLAAQLEAATAEADRLAPQRRQRLWLEGHPNFAHQLLNGLTCLDQEDGAALGPVLSEGPEAFGPLRELFPAVQWLDAAVAKGGAWFELPLSQRPERISRRLRRQLRCRAAMVLGREALELERRLLAWKASGGWVLAVSVKARGAVAEGLNELLAAWLAALARQGPLPLLLIDGFSLPSGDTAATGVPAYRCTAGEVISAEAGQIRALHAALAAAELAVENVVTAGRSLLESLHLLQYTDVYFMHQGTVQHKIGWFQESIPGIVHSNSQRNHSDPTQGGVHPWGGMGETAPIWFPAEGCEDLGAGPRGRYRFRAERLKANVEWLCGQLADLGLIPQAPKPFSLQDLDAWMLHRSLRRYQKLVFDQVDFSVRIDDVEYVFESCIATNSVNRLLLSRRGDGALFELVSDRCGSGFSLEAGPGQLLAIALENSPLPSGKPVLRIGDANFAHFIWNELDPLLHLISCAQEHGGCVGVVQDSDSILNLGTLPGVELLGAEVLERQPSVHVGAMWVSAAARKVALATLGAPLEATRRPAHSPMLILGVRGSGRRELRNEVDLLSDLIKRLHQGWPELRIVLDGFTFQHNNCNDPGSLARAKAIADRIDQIQAACPEIELESLNGLSFEAYLPRVAEASMYVTHEGTIQHKIGWFYPQIPGVCLVAGEHAEAVASWHRAQCDGVPQLSVLPVGLLIHVARGETSADVADAEQRNQAFMAQDTKATIDAIAQLIRSYLGCDHAENPVLEDSLP